MLLKKTVRRLDKGIYNESEYSCDMCRRNITKNRRYLLGISEIGGDSMKKRWDLCPKCMKTIEKNVAMWYDKFIIN